jgi:hypothetical protein
MSTIRAQSLRRAAPLLLAAAWLGCTEDEPTAPKPASQALASLRSITGRLLGPDGRSICRTVPKDTTLVELLNPDFDGSNDAFLDLRGVACPDNSFALGLDATTAHLRVELPLSQDIDRLPWRSLDEFTVPPGGVNHPVHIVEGTALGGRATLDGQPLEGVPMTLLYDFNPGFGVTFTNSGPDGRWVEFFGRSPPRLDDGNRYLAVGCFILGATLPKGFPTSGFLFPSSRQGVNCRFETAPATRFSHTATRLAVTPMPGDIGGSFSGELFDQFGVGWGVQFPIPPGSSPLHADPIVSQMFNGGLIIGVPAQGGHPARVLLGADGAGEFECGETCRDLGLDGVVTFSPTGARGERKQVTWRYSDAGSSDAVGLQVIQHSIDGIRPHDYVLFRFRIRNISPSALRFYAGYFGDMDVDFDNADDLGATALEGRLMYQVSAAESGIHVGTLLLGEAPVTGNYFFGPEQDPVSVHDQIRALRGDLQRKTAGPTDLRYIHGVGPITLNRQQAQDVWLAVVAGESRRQLLDNAAAARAHVAKLVNLPISDEGETSRMVITGPSRAATQPTCKSCKPK